MSSATPLLERTTLGATPLLHVLISLLARKATGTLAVDSSQGSLHVQLQCGSPKKLGTTIAVARLSDVLINLGCIASEAAEDSFEQAHQQGILHGHWLLERQFMNADVLQAALKSQATAKLCWASALPPESSISFTGGSDWLASAPLLPEFNSPLELVWAVARTWVDQQCVAAVLRHLVNRPLSLHPLAQPAWFGFTRDESEVLDILSAGTADMQSLIQQVSVPVRIVQVMLYVLAITRQLDLGTAKPPIGYWNSQSGEHRVTGGTPPLEQTGVVLQKNHAPLQTQGNTAIDRIHRAAHSVHRAEFLLDQQRVDEAEKEIRVGLEHDPAHPECRALNAWIQVCKYGEAADLNQILAVLSDCLEKLPVHETIRFRRAQVLARIGRAEQAQREFELIVELNPRHVDALREIRLWQLRQRSRRGASGKYPAVVREQSSTHGLFVKFFKKR